MIADTGDGQGGGGWGETFGINLLGVGDCNNDGLFNNFDIDCLEDLYEEYGLREGGERRVFDGDDDEYVDLEYLRQVVRQLRDFFEML